MQIKGLEGASIYMWITAEEVSNKGPCCPYINLTLVPGSRLVGGDFRATLLLENPLGHNTLTYTQLQAEVRYIVCGVCSVCVHRAPLGYHTIEGACASCSELLHTQQGAGIGQRGVT